MSPSSGKDFWKGLLVAPEIRPTTDKWKNNFFLNVETPLTYLVYE